MNLSGNAVRLLSNAYAESTDDVIIVYDDIDLPLGKLRIRPSGSAGTHNGMRSIVEELGTERIPRLRVGIGAQEQGRLRDYVLDEFAPDEQPAITRAIERAVDALLLFARGDLKRAMNEFNRDLEESSSE
jgi:PTH1 family peptidyl-tRNA hydrolase